MKKKQGQQAALQSSLKETKNTKLTETPVQQSGKGQVATGANSKKNVVIMEPKEVPVQVPKVDENPKKDERIKVCIRVRPKLKHEHLREDVVAIDYEKHAIRLSDHVHIVESKYDAIFDKSQAQQSIYEFVKDSITGVFDGFNSTIFAYGQTGSGKTYTMFGPQWEETIIFNKKQQQSKNSKPMDYQLLMQKDQEGVIPKSVRHVFQQMKVEQGKGKNSTIYCSFIQIYNEKIYDLLQDIETKKPLKIRETQGEGIFVEGKSEYIVQTENDCFALLKRGELNRITRQTKKNMLSSRSHSIFQLLVESDQADSRGMLKRAKLNLCDLAGSEKIQGLEENNPVHISELKTINLSLTTLGKVIQALSKEGKNLKKNANLFTPRDKQDYYVKVHVPYRDSQLTRILQDSLGGNTRTVLIGTISPVIDNIEESISTLKFADRAKQVMATIKANEINAKDDALVQKLQREVQTLREVLSLRAKGAGQSIQKELLILKEENLKLKEIAENSEQVERLKLENKLMKLELQKMKETSSTSGYPLQNQLYQDFDSRGISTNLSLQFKSGEGTSGMMNSQAQRDPFAEFQDYDPEVAVK